MISARCGVHAKVIATEAMAHQKTGSLDTTHTRSRELYRESAKFLAGGVSSNFRLNERPTPVFFESAAGCRLRSVDGNEYIDYALGMGPAILGHADRTVNSAVAAALDRGQLYAGQHEGELTLARLVCDLVPCAERVRFSLSGSEAIQAALRVARAFTGRRRIIKFEGHYHGWFDNIFSGIRAAETVGPDGGARPETEGQPASALDDLLVIPWNDVEALSRALNDHVGEVAAVIMEPVLCNTCVILPRSGYMESVRKLCSENGAVLIFDEVITGFRVSLGGAQQMLGVTPDLAVFAKAFANGFPGSCLAGRAYIIDLFASGRVMHGGTYNTNLVSTAASIATLRRLAEEDGAIYRQMNEVGDRLMSGMRKAAAAAGVPLLVQGVGTVFHTAFTSAETIVDYRSWLESSDQSRLAVFIDALLENGVRITRRGTWFLSAAHTTADIDATIEAAVKSFRRVASA